MACDLTTGRAIPCKDSVGGLKAVYFADFGTMGVVTFDGTDTDMIANLASTSTVWFKYDLVGSANTFGESMVASEDNGTSFSEQTLNVTLAKLNIKTHKELKLLIYGRPHTVVEDNNGSFFMAGLEHGVNGTLTTATGGAMGDLNGYTLALIGREKIPANFLDTSLTNVLTGGATISATQITP